MVVEAIFQQVLRMGGSLSGEHGIGCAKLRWVAMQQGWEPIAIQHRTKQLFDPKGIMNPG